MDETSFWSSRGEKEEEEGREGGGGRLTTTIRTETEKEKEMKNPCNLILCSKYGMERSSVKAVRMRENK